MSQDHISEPLTVVRIPVAGPAPNNTLVFVRGWLPTTSALDPGAPGQFADFADGLPDTASEGAARVAQEFPTPYVINQYDADHPEKYENTKISVTAFLSTVDLAGDEDAFWGAVTSVTGRIHEDDGRLLVKVGLALEEKDGELIGHTELSLAIFVSAWILTYEPQPDFPPQPEGTRSIAGAVISDHATLGDSHIRSAIRASAARLVPYADLLQLVLPEAVAAQARVFRLMNEARDTARQSQREFETLLNRSQSRELGLSPDSLARIQERIRGQAKSGLGRRIPGHSPQAKAMTLQPVRDVTVNGVVVLAKDRKLDILGASYRDAWSTSEIRNVDHGVPRGWAAEIHGFTPNLHWADRDCGTMGFDHDAIREDVSSGAALYFGFKPPITPGVAQVRPFLPYSYRYFKGQSAGGFGILVWSWNMRGGDLSTEQDYRYFVWRDSIGGSTNPSYYDHPGQPELCFDSDYAFLYGTQAHYFNVRPDRIYMAAVWCFGDCSEHNANWTDGQIHAELPWVVIGYQ